MTVPSVAFLFFAAGAAILFNLSRSHTWRGAILLLANLMFLATFSADPIAYAPFAGFLAAGYAGIRVMQSRPPRRAFPILLCSMLLAFCWLKRYSIIPSFAFLDFPYATIGLSYIFFRVVHLIIDAHQRSLPAKIGILAYLNYTLNFTSLVSGPIQRYQDFERMQSADASPLSVIVVGRALERIIVGFLKVSVLSSALSVLHHWALEMLTTLPTFSQRAVAGMLVATVYPLYLYANFSGYTDFVIGVARFFGIQLPENFDRPFSSENFITFWNRWHITLSMWLKTYVYNPLLAVLMVRIPSARLQPFLGVVAFFVTFFLIGAWHGQTTEFLVYGVLLGFGVSINKLYQIEMTKWLGRSRYKTLCAHLAYRAFSCGLTFSWFSVTLFFFWSTWQQLGQIVGELGLLGLASVWALTLLVATAALTTYEFVRGGLQKVDWNKRPMLLDCGRTVLNTSLATLIFLINVPAPDLVYKGF